MNHVPSTVVCSVTGTYPDTGSRFPIELLILNSVYRLVWSRKFSRKRASSRPIHRRGNLCFDTSNEST